jgi:hypothetical protein
MHTALGNRHTNVTQKAVNCRRRWLLRGGRIGAVRNLVRNMGTIVELLDDSSAVPWRATAALVLAIGYVASVDAKPEKNAAN